ncbi:MAG: group III truncated hemoglobin [Alphaproteobacteria bacterium]|nr:group III truncated hemoglobin [Alphaproteobacteria bacterium]
MFDHVTDETIGVLIRSFYGKVRRDPQLGPIFQEAIGTNWDNHISKMCDFWGAAMRISRRYSGDMLTAHRRVKGIQPALFGRWLDLFEQTVTEHFAGTAGAALCDRARKTAHNLQLALFYRRDARPAAAAVTGANSSAHASDAMVAPIMPERRA